MISKLFPYCQVAKDQTTPRRSFPMYNVVATCTGKASVSKLKPRQRNISYHKDISRLVYEGRSLFSKHFCHMLIDEIL